MSKKYDEDENYDEILNEENEENEEYEEDYDNEEYDDDDEEENSKVNKIAKILAIVLGVIALGMIILFVVVKSKKPIASADSTSHTHVFAEEFTIDKEATCKTRGVESRHCTVEGCDVTTDERKIDRTEHQFDDGKVTKEPTCTEEGVKTYTCKICGEEKEEAIFPIDHAYGPGNVEKQATCLQDGLVVYECTRCGNKKEETIPKTAHEFNAATFSDTSDPLNVKYYKTCKLCGSYVYTDSQGNILDENAVNAPTQNTSNNTNNTSSDKAIENCKAGKHDYAEVGTRTEPTCTTEGKVTYACRICGNEKTEVLPKKEHNNEEITVESTCEKQGTVTVKCKDCGYITSTKYLDLKDHTFGDAVVIEEGNCSSSRIVRYTCTVCGYTKDENKGTTDDHNYETVTVQEGDNEYAVTRCSRCGKETSKTLIGSTEKPSTQTETEDGVIIINN